MFALCLASPPYGVGGVRVQRHTYTHRILLRLMPSISASCQSNPPYAYQLRLVTPSGVRGVRVQRHTNTHRILLRLTPSISALCLASPPYA